MPSLFRLLQLQLAGVLIAAAVILGLAGHASADDCVARRGGEFAVAQGDDRAATFLAQGKLEKLLDRGHPAAIESFPMVVRPLLNVRHSGVQEQAGRHQ